MELRKLWVDGHPLPKGIYIFDNRSSPRWRYQNGAARLLQKYLFERNREGRNSNFDYVIVFDCDNIISSWLDKEAFINAVKFLARKEQNAAVFANTRGFYYDVWTLRHPIWCPGDCWSDVERLSAFISHREAVFSCVGARQVRIKSSTPPVPVTSAFGGLAIYKRRYLLGRRYFAKNPDGTPACEHVALNESISSDNGSLFIFPELLVTTPYEHIHRARDKCSTVPLSANI